jgi:hypothetical protein
MSGIKLLVTQILEKKPEDYKKIREGNATGKPGNPSSPHPFDYASKGVLVVNPITFKELQAGSQVARQEVREMLEEKDLHGDFIIQRPLGGLGRQGRWETTVEWKAKRKSGMPEICRISLD